jgi:hypothetical protein
MSTTTNAIRNHPFLSGGIGLATLTGGAVAIAGAVRKRRKKKTTTKKRKSTTTRKTKRKTAKTTARRRTKASKRINTKKIYYTKTGQPYIKMASGKARFISKKSAKARKKRKGGYY